MRAYQKVLREATVQQSRDTQYEDENCRVRVKSGYDRRHDAYVTDIVIIDRTSTSGEHWHMIIDEDGRVLHEGWRSNKGR